MWKGLTDRWHRTDVLFTPGIYRIYDDISIYTIEVLNDCGCIRAAGGALGCEKTPALMTVVRRTTYVESLPPGSILIVPCDDLDLTVRIQTVKAFEVWIE